MATALRKMIFTVPTTSEKSGGYSAEIDKAELLRDTCEVEIVTYETRSEGFRFLPDVVTGPVRDDEIFVTHWGPDVPRLLHMLKGRNTIHHSHSTGYGFKVPVDVPILTVSRNSMAYWGKTSPSSFILYAPNYIPQRFFNRHVDRDIDVLVQQRKSSPYLLDQLVPALQKQGLNVLLLDSWVDDITVYFNRSKVYLYDSSDFWNNKGVSEGFGLPPLEALACGCSVFSNVSDALADYLSPGVNCQKIRCVSLDYDVRRVKDAVSKWQDFPQESAAVTEFRQATVLKVWHQALVDLNDYFNARRGFTATIEPVVYPKPVKPSATLSRVTKKFHSALKRLRPGKR